jgi:O-antigen ligase
VVLVSFHEAALISEAEIRLATPSVSYVATRHTAGLLERAIFFALLSLIVLVAIPFGSVEPWWEAVFECVVFALVALWIFDGLLNGAWRVSGYRLIAPLVAINLLAFVQTIPLGGAATGINGEVWNAVSADPYQTRHFVLKLIALTLGGMLLLRYMSNERQLRMLIQVVIGVGMASALFGILRQLVQAGAPDLVWAKLPADRSYAQFIDRNHFAFLIEMALGLQLGLMTGGGVLRSRRLFYLATALLLGGALVLSNSRGGIFTMLCQLLFLLLLFRAPRPVPTEENSRNVPVWLHSVSTSFITRAALIACLLAAVSVSILWVGGDPLMHRLETVPREFSKNENDSRMNTGRVAIWEATWKAIRAHPIAGSGFGAFWITFPTYHDGSGVFTAEEAQFRPLAAHNEYLELLASGGWIGGALGAWFLIALVRCSREGLRAARDPFHRSASVGALVGLFGIAVHSLVDFGLHDTVNAFVFTALVVIATFKLDLERNFRIVGSV